MRHEQYYRMYANGNAFWKRNVPTWWGVPVPWFPWVFRWKFHFGLEFNS